MRRRNDAVDIKTILKKISKNPKLKKRLEETEILEKVNLIVGETISLPISFIVGVSFISGSITAGFFATNSNHRKE